MPPRLSLCRFAHALLVSSVIAICVSSADPKPLDFTLSIPKTTYVQCEPVPVTVEVKNVSDETVRVFFLLEQAFGVVQWRISGPGDRPHKVSGGSILLAATPRELAPGEAVTHHELWHHSSEWGHHFKQPGEYRIQATFRDRVRAHEYTSNELRITVYNAGGVDAAALEEHFDGNPQGVFLRGGSDARAIGREFEEVLRKYPACTYAPWCYYALGRAWQSRAIEFQSLRREVGLGDQTNPALSEAAIKTYEQLLESYPEFPFAPEVRYQIAKERLRLGDKQTALTEFEKLFKEHPNLLLLRNARRKVEGLPKLGHEVTAIQLP